MPVGNYFRSLTSFDLLGNLIPGTIVLFSVLSILSEPPVPSRAYEFALFGIAAFISGEIIQSWAAVAVGKRVHFKRTLEREDDISGVLSEESRSQESETSQDEEDSSVDTESQETQSEDQLTQSDQDCCRLVLKILHAYVGPLFGWIFPPRGSAVNDKVHANEAIDYITYRLRNGLTT